MGEVRLTCGAASLDNPPQGLMDAEVVDGQETQGRARSDWEVGAVVHAGAYPERFVVDYDVSELLEDAGGGTSVRRRAASLTDGVASTAIGWVGRTLGFSRRRFVRMASGTPCSR